MLTACTVFSGLDWYKAFILSNAVALFLFLPTNVSLGIDNIDDFDLLCHVVFDQKPLTRSDRARNVRQKPYFEKYSEKAKRVLEILVDKYANGAIDDFDDMDCLKLPELQEEFGSPVNIVSLFGGKAGWLQATQDLQNAMYRRAY